MMTPAQSRGWLDTAAPSASITYHTGNVARDRKAWTDRDGAKHKATPGLHDLAKAVASAAENGAVALVQKRIGPDHWQYAAIRSSPAAARIRGYSVGRRIVAIASIPRTVATALPH